MGKFQQLYHSKILSELMKQFKYKTPMQVPKIMKVTLNMGLGEAVGDKKILAAAMTDMEKISGQKPIPTYARKSIAGFKIREDWPIGCKVTLRKKRMYDFLERLVCVAIPRIRDFRGFSAKAFDGRGNYNLGITEQIIFPEVDYDKIDMIRGLDIAITTNVDSVAQARELLKQFNFPFKE